MIFLSKLCDITIQPSYNIAIVYLSDIISLLLKLVFFWKTSNYADSYWFLYTNKQDAFIKRNLNN